MEFPRSEAKVGALAAAIIQGLRHLGPGDPPPPVPVDQLEALDAEVKACHAATVRQDAEARIQHVEKAKVFRRYKKSLKTTLRWAEAVFRDHPEQLSAFGWGLPRPKTALEPPGQTLNIVILGEGKNWVVLDWKAPVDGGAVAAYKIQRRSNRGDWEDVATSVESELHLKNQLRGAELEFQVIALNRAGEGPPSGVVALVL